MRGNGCSDTYWRRIWCLHAHPTLAISKGVGSTKFRSRQPIVPNCNTVQWITTKHGSRLYWDDDCSIFGLTPTPHDSIWWLPFSAIRGIYLVCSNIEHDLLAQYRGNLDALKSVTGNEDLKKAFKHKKKWTLKLPIWPEHFTTVEIFVYGIFSKFKSCRWKQN